MTKSLYGKTADGKEVFSFTIKNESGAEIELLNYGATLNKYRFPTETETLPMYLSALTPWRVS